MQLDDLLLDRVLGDQTVNGNGSRLADAVRAIGGLALDGRVPPRVEVNDVVGGSEIEPEAACLEAHQKERCLASLEGSDALTAGGLGRRAIEVEVAEATFVELFANELEKIDELTEHQRAVPVRGKLLGQLEEGLHFGALTARLRKDQPRVAAEAPQPRDLGEDLELVVAFAVHGAKFLVDLPA
jgi:hypothetical protein